MSDKDNTSPPGQIEQRFREAIVKGAAQEMEAAAQEMRNAFMEFAWTLFQERILRITFENLPMGWTGISKVLRGEFVVALEEAVAKAQAMTQEIKDELE